MARSQVYTEGARDHPPGLLWGRANWPSAQGACGPLGAVFE